MRTHWTQVAQSLHDAASGAGRGDQMLRGGVTQIHNPLAEHNAAGRAIGQVSAPGRNLGAEAKHVRSASARDLHPRADLASERLGDVARAGPTPGALFQRSRDNLRGYCRLPRWILAAGVHFACCQLNHQVPELHAASGMSKLRRVHE
ncbi:hypothetical protein X769_13980 [Mesorhizobium sp. LSJC268A00]|nr:hypothetical protein X769_13980 [Mesorhizobium sp. LSJC268A00]